MVTAESHSVGTVKFEVYSKYFKSMGAISFYTMLASSALSIAAALASSIWLGTWAEDGNGSNAKPTSYYIGIYVVLSVATVVLNLIANISGFDGAVVASSSIHKNLVHSLLMAPISFFDSTPLGRITNRMSKDMNQIDTLIMFQFQLLAK